MSAEPHEFNIRAEALEYAARLAESLVWREEDLRGASAVEIQQSETAAEIAGLIRDTAHREHLREVIGNWGKCERYRPEIDKALEGKK